MTQPLMLVCVLASCDRRHAVESDVLKAYAGGDAWSHYYGEHQVKDA